MKADINSDRSENIKYDYPDFPTYVRRALLSAYPNYKDTGCAGKRGANLRG